MDVGKVFLASQIGGAFHSVEAFDTIVVLGVIIPCRDMLPFKLKPVLTDFSLYASLGGVHPGSDLVVS